MPQPSPPFVAQSTAATTAATAVGTRAGIAGILETLPSLQDYTVYRLGATSQAPAAETGDKGWFF